MVFKDKKMSLSIEIIFEMMNHEGEHWYYVPFRHDYRCYIIILPGREG